MEISVFSGSSMLGFDRVAATALTLGPAGRLASLCPHPVLTHSI